MSTYSNSGDTSYFDFQIFERTGPGFKEARIFTFWFPGATPQNDGYGVLIIFDPSQRDKVFVERRANSLLFRFPTRLIDHVLYMTDKYRSLHLGITWDDATNAVEDFILYTPAIGPLTSALQQELLGSMKSSEESASAEARSSAEDQ